MSNVLIGYLFIALDYFALYGLIRLSCCLPHSSNVNLDIAAARRPTGGRSLREEQQVGGAWEPQVGGAYAGFHRSLKFYKFNAFS